MVRVIRDSKESFLLAGHEIHREREPHDERLVWADKKMRIRSSGPYGVVEKLVDVPDWDMRLKAIKYIDQIDGIMPTNASQINLLQRFN